MRRLVVLGAGTAGTMVVNKLRRRLEPARWSITVVDRDDTHVYQPGLLFVPFGTYRPDEVKRSRRTFVPDNVDLLIGEIDSVDAAGSVVRLADGREIGYDYLVIATGVAPRADQTLGRRAHGGYPVASRGLPKPARDRNVATRLDSRWHPHQRAVQVVPGQAR